MNQIIINLSFLLPQPTGISTYALNIAPYLQELNPTWLSPQPLDHLTTYPIPNHLTPDHGLIGHLNRLIWTQFKLPQIYQQLNSNLLYSPLPEAPLHTSCRYIIMVHDLIPLRFPKYSPLTWYYRHYLPYILKSAQHIICNSQTTAQDINQYYQIGHHKITPIYLGYDKELFHPHPKTQTQTHPYFLYIGRHTPYKNLIRLIKAFSQIPHCQDYQLWIAGSPDRRYTPNLIKLTQELTLPNIKFLNYIPLTKLPQILSEAIALVFVSLWEGFGIPLIEAMACGTPVITSNISALPEIAKQAAILVDPYNISEIAAAMSAIATNSQLSHDLKQKGLDRVLDFSWSTTGYQTVEILKRFT